MQNPTTAGDGAYAAYDVWDGVKKDQQVQMICCLEELNFQTEA